MRLKRRSEYNDLRRLVIHFRTEGVNDILVSILSDPHFLIIQKGIGECCGIGNNFACMCRKKGNVVQTKAARRNVAHVRELT